MAAPEAALDQISRGTIMADEQSDQIKFLQLQLTEVLGSLSQIFDRVRQLEAVVGTDSHQIPRTEEWHTKLEQAFIKLLRDHHWDWMEQEEGVERRIYERHYHRILRIGEMLPLDRCLVLWQKHANHRYPLPRVWTDTRPFLPEEDHFEGQTTKKLMKILEKHGEE